MGNSMHGLSLVIGLLAVTGGCLANDFFADFTSLDGWTYSDDPKYTGRFEAATPEGWEGPGLKVWCPATGPWNVPSRS